MGRIRRGWELTKKSWSVLKEHRQLIRFPLYGGIATLIFGAITLGPGVFFIDDESYGLGVPLAIIGFYLLAFIGVYFGVGLAACADRIFKGESPTVGDGLAVANSRLPQIAGWAIVATVVGLVLNAIANRTGVGGAILGRLLDIGWSLITFLAVPVIALEGPGPLDTLKRSASLFKSRWGQQVTGNIAIGGAAILFGTIPGGLLIFAGIALWATSGIGGGALVALGVLVVAIAALIAGALKGIFGVALYHYTQEGEAIGGFTPEEFESAVGKQKPATA